MTSDIKQVAMGAKPDPYNFTIVKKEIIDGNTIILANYPGSLTFGGDKLMLLKGEYQEIGDTLDPHFLDEDYAVVARFLPTEMGWELARLCSSKLYYTKVYEDSSRTNG